MDRSISNYFTFLFVSRSSVFVFVETYTFSLSYFRYYLFFFVDNDCDRSFRRARRLRTASKHDPTTISTIQPPWSRNGDAKGHPENETQTEQKNITKRQKSLYNSTFFCRCRARSLFPF